MTAFGPPFIAGPSAAVDSRNGLRSRRSTKEMKATSAMKSSTASAKIPAFVLRATVTASLGGILFGYDMGVISGALPQLTEEFKLSDGQQEWVVGILYLGGGFGAAIGGSLCDSVGRKTAIIVTDLLFAAGAILLSSAYAIEQIMVGRVIMGFAIAVSGIADVAYLHEIAPAPWRGSIVSVNEACISLGFLAAFLCGVVFEVRPNGWRVMFGLSGWVALIQLVGMYFMPESPQWLRDQGREEERQAALMIIHGGNIPTEIPDSEDEYESKRGMGQCNSSDHLEPVGCGKSYETLAPPPPSSGELSSSGPSHHHATLCQRIAYGYRIVVRYYRQSWIAFFLSVVQQLSGQAAVLNYAPHIFSSFHHSGLSATLWIGVVKFLITIIVIWRIEYMGRRFLLQFGMAVIALGQLLIAFAFTMDNLEQDAPRSAMYFGLPGVLLVVLGYSASFGPLTWLLTSELFPTDIRGRMLGASTIVTYLCASLVTSTFLSLQTRVGGAALFCAYGFITAVSIIFVHLAIIDTGSKSVEEIDKELKEMWWWRSRHESSNADSDGWEDELPRPRVLEGELA